MQSWISKVEHTVEPWFTFVALHVMAVVYSDTIYPEANLESSSDFWRLGGCFRDNIVR